IVSNLAIGAWAHRKATAGSFEDYALASRNLPTGVLVMTLLGTFVGGGNLLDPEWAYKHGFLQGLGNISYIIVFILVGTFLAPSLVYFNDCYTIGDLMKRFYGSIAQLFSSLIGILISLFIISSQIQTIGKVSNVIFEIDPSLAIFIFGIIIVIYSAWGGMRAITYTDVLQLMMCFFVLTLICGMLIQRIGGIQEILNAPPKKLSILSNPNFYFKLKIISFWVIFPTFLLTPPIFQRMLITQDKRKVRSLWYVSAFFYAVISIYTVLIGIGSYVGREELGLDTRINLLPRLAKSLFGEQGLAISFVFVGMIAILISTIDSFFHAMGVSIMHDLVDPIAQFFGKKSLKVEKKLLYTKFAIISVGCLCIAMALWDSSGLLTNLKYYSYAVFLYAIVLVPLIFGILGFKTDQVSLITCCITYAISIFIFYSLGWGKDSYFLPSIFLATLTYFITHIYINKGIATLTRSKLTVAERLWIPSWEGTMKQLHSWLTAPLRLPAIADRKIVTTPTQSLAFSLVMIFLYMVGSITVVDASNEALYRMAAIRGIGITLCVGLMLEGIWSKGLKPYFPMYWFFTLWYCLSFAGSLTFLQSQQGAMSIALWVGGFILLAIIVDSVTFSVLVTSGLALAFGGWRIVYGGLPEDIWQGNKMIIAVVIVVILIVGILLFSRRREEYNIKRFEWNRIAAGILAHDLRGTVQMLGGSGNTLQNAFKEGEEMNNKEGKEGYHLSKGRSLFLKNLSQHMVDKAYFARRDIASFLDFMQSQILGKFEQAEMSMKQAAKEATHKVSTQISKKVKITCPQDFTAKTLTGIFPNVIGNLLKNASTHGNAQAIEIIIDSKKRTLTIHDDGKGIPSDVLPHIFDLHYSTTKGKENSGTGLAFVRMVMEASGGKVSCYSKHGTKGSFTDFVLDFSKR
ncbi:MAG: ATP-binding protein, partial [Bacteroidota bacterium]